MPPVAETHKPMIDRAALHDLKGYVCKDDRPRVSPEASVFHSVIDQEAPVLICEGYVTPPMEFLDTVSRNSIASSEYIITPPPEFSMPMPMPASASPPVPQISALSTPPKSAFSVINPDKKVRIKVCKINQVLQLSASRVKIQA